MNSVRKSELTIRSQKGRIDDKRGLFNKDVDDDLPYTRSIFEIWANNISIQGQQLQWNERVTKSERQNQPSTFLK